MKRDRNLFSIVMAMVLLIGLLLPNSQVSATTTDGTATMDQHLLEEMKQNTSLINVIVTFHGEGAPTNENVALLKTLGINTGVTMQSLPIAGVLATSQQIEALSKREDVRSLYLNRKVEMYNGNATELTGVNKVRTDQEMQKANGGLPVSGKGVGVVVNDSGVDGTHPDMKLGKNLVQNVLGTTNMAKTTGLTPIVYQEDVVNTDTNSGHGTHVAGTVGGTGAASSGQYEGVAPGADLIGYGSGGGVLILDLVGGFDYAITNQNEYNIRIITNSWGSNDDFFADDPVNVATKDCYDRGITVLFAAGNAGPDEDTHNPYAKAPWVISVAAGKKDGTLADFSSRGTRGVGETFEVDGQTWTWKDQPTVTAPGVDIISARTLSPVGVISTHKDKDNIPAAYLPYYTMLNGTSMATPHIAGVVALLFDAEPTLSPNEVKEIISQTATNMPGREAYEVGAGYVNAYGAVDLAMNPSKKYGATVNKEQTFNAQSSMEVIRENYAMDYNPTSENETTFTVQDNQAQLVAKMYADGDTFTEEGGNPLVFTITNPNGEVYESGFNPTYSIDLVNTITVENPVAGEWKLNVNAYPGVAVPEKVVGTLTQKTASTMNGLTDIEGHPAADAIRLGITERLFDAKSGGDFYADNLLTRGDLASYLIMGAGIRQVEQITDDAAMDAVFTKGAALKGEYSNDGVMRSEESNSDYVTRAELAYSLVQSLGLQDEARSFEGELTVAYKGERLAIEDAGEIPSELMGYVQLAIDLGIFNVKYTSTQEPYDLEPTIHATFQPEEKVTRGDFAVAMTRFINNY
ncbi:S8 family serine peptidase [Pseudalkalibacillus berkeleyi]|uniref:S8 family serine peptidase n=1 Tax=Pseudalkalibacillus berkeleyi TaxID=1069813 RepID=A0ABS9GV88_9BACL|nr:S8 family serine peptidase [Pseudalkalibacillus berkeleyi]MCF6136599.1 S8 family serine peptidase [Pseudalkalibacillus berkeleyi]